MVRWGLLAAGCACLLACQSSGAFTCSEDSQCVAGDAVGACEANGHCSFFDPECPSERRFGQAAATDLAGTCVPLPDDVPGPSSGTSGPTTTSLTTIGTESSTGQDTEPSTSSMVSMTSEDTSGGGSLSASGDSSEGSFSSSGESGSSSSGQVPCETFVDDFEDGEIDPFWDVFNPIDVSEADGELRIALVPPSQGYTGIGTLAGFDLANGTVTAELGETPQFPGYQLVLVARSPAGNSYLMVLQHDLLEVRRTLDGQPEDELFDGPYDPNGHRFFRIAGDGGELLFQVSGDGETFTTIASSPEEETQLRIDMTGVDWASDGTTPVVTFRSFVYCDLDA